MSKDPSGTSLVPLGSVSSLTEAEKEFVAKAIDVEVNQAGSRAGGDIVGGDKTTNYNFALAHERGIVRQLMEKLADEMKADQKVRHIVDSLQLFYLRKSIDGIDGLEAKLKHADRTDELLFALEKKEHFAKLLEKWSLYASAQEIFAYLLAKAEHQFSTTVHSNIGTCTRYQVDQLITEAVVEPLIKECGVGAFNLNHSVAMGMLYWLAEQCFVRWHA